MSKLNKTNVKPAYTTTSHKNYMDGDSWDLSNPFIRLRMVAASSFFGEPRYYNEDGSVNKALVVKTEMYTRAFKNKNDLCKSLKEFLGDTVFDSLITDNQFNVKTEMESLIDECLDKDVEKTLQLAVSLRNEDLIRSTPQVILVRAAMNKNSKGTGLIAKYIDQICKRGDEPAAALSYLISTYGKDTPIPNSLKKGLKKVLEGFNGYEISKYKMENNFVKTRDVVNLVHAYSKDIDKLMNGKAKQTKTWNSIVSNAKKDEKTKQEIWTEALEGMPHMALLRNLRNLISNNVDENLYLDRLLNGVEGGKQLPFRYYSAYKTIENIASSRVLDTVEECLEKSFQNSPHFSGRTMVLSDNSGSAWGTLTSDLGIMHIAEIGNLMGVMTAKMADEGEIGIFGDRLDIIKVRKKQSIFDLIEKCDTAGQGIGGGTENGIWLFFDKALKNKEHYDNIFVYSDMQAGHGGLYGMNPDEYKNFQVNDSHYINVPKLINEYRKVVNPNVMIYLIQTAGYKDILIPEYFDRTFILGGWSSNIPLFAAKMSEIREQK